MTDQPTPATPPPPKTSVHDAVSPEEARRRGVELVVVPTVEAIELLRSEGAGTNAILHVTC